jgi:hypothetical protein
MVNWQWRLAKLNLVFTCEVFRSLSNTLKGHQQVEEELDMVHAMSDTRTEVAVML